MALYKIGERYPNYQDIYFQGNDVKGMDVIGAEGTRVGSVRDVLIDEESRLQFLVIVLTNQSHVLLPADRCARSFEQNRMYVRSLSQTELNALQPYSEQSFGKIEDASAQPAAKHTVTADESTLTQPIQLYEEQLVTQKRRVKTGEVKISKKIITETTDNEIPITREKVIIEIESIYAGQTRVDFGDAEVSEDGTVRLGIYEEQAQVCRRIVPYQNVSIRKETVQDVIRTQQTIRREELDIQTEGEPDVDGL